MIIFKKSNINSAGIFNIACVKGKSDNFLVQDILPTNFICACVHAHVHPPISVQRVFEMFSVAAAVHVAIITCFFFTRFSAIIIIAHFHCSASGAVTYFPILIVIFKEETERHVVRIL